MIAFEKALQRVIDAAVVVDDTEVVPLAAAADRISSEAIVSTIDVPGFDNSAMDGYAVVTADIAAGKTYPVSQRIVAGTAETPLKKGTVARVFTGAPVPQGADAVIMQENAVRQGDHVSFTELPKVGQHIRPAGDDICKGKKLLDKGSVLGAAELGVFASIGLATVPCYRRPVIGIFSTGDELVQPGQPLQPGQIYNSNRFFLARMLQRCGADVRDIGVCSDSYAETRRTVESAIKDVDCLVTTGGMSVGEEDHMRALIDDLGDMQFSKVAMKPGKPVAFGRLLDCCFFGLPGNPVSAFATFYLLVRPWLLKTSGRAVYLPLRLRVRVGKTIRNQGGRMDFRRVRVSQAEDGLLSIHVHGNQSSGVFSAVAETNALLPLAPGEVYNPGDMCEVILVEGL